MPRSLEHRVPRKARRRRPSRVHRNDRGIRTLRAGAGAGPGPDPVHLAGSRRALARSRLMNVARPTALAPFLVLAVSVPGLGGLDLTSGFSVPNGVQDS